MPRWWRPLLALYPLLMTLALVYAGEHYVVDCIAGWIYALGSYLAVNLRLRVRARRRTRSRPRSPIERSGRSTSAT